MYFILEHIIEPAVQRCHIMSVPFLLEPVYNTHVVFNVLLKLHVIVYQ